MRARYAHYLVYPERSRTHAGFQAFRDWLHAEAQQFRDSGASDAPADGNSPIARAPRKRNRVKPS
jgi:LysR family glycine cleavage system transcriptional activator